MKDKVKCGYCGQSIIGENGTAKSGERKYYYKCRGRKSKITDCDNPAIRKDVLEKIVLDSVLNELNKPDIMNKIVAGVLEEQERQIKNNTVLSLFEKELKNTETLISNVMSAIEKGVVTNTTTSRLKELEEKKADLEKQILIEKNKKAEVLTEKDVRQFYRKALELEPKMLIHYLIREIVLYKDKIEIHYNMPIQGSPKQQRGFSFSKKTFKFAYDNSFKREMIKVRFEVETMIP